MSQTGYTPIQLYYSTTASNTPSVANLSLGELGINLADQKAYMLNAAGTAVVTLVGTLGNQNANSVSITGGSVNGTTIGATTASTGAFTTISATGVITSTVATGTAPFTIASTTQVANLNAATAGTATNATNTAITDNTSSSATWYPTIVSATTGNLPQTTSSTKLSFVPSTGTLTATSHAGAWAGSTIGTGYGGTGLTSFTANGVVYASSTSALATSSNLTYDGTNGYIAGNWNIGASQNGANLDVTGLIKVRPASTTAYAISVGASNTTGIYQKMLTSQYLGTGSTVYIDMVSWATYVRSAGSNQYDMVLLDKSGNLLFDFRYDGVLVSTITYGYAVGGTNRAMYVDNSGNFGYNSSIRASKKNINPITDVSWLLKLVPVTFNKRKQNDSGEYTEDVYDDIDYGLIAEDTQPFNDNIVFYDDVTDPTTGQVTKTLKGIHYDRLISPILALVQQQATQIANLEARLKAANIA